MNLFFLIHLLFFGNASAGENPLLVDQPVVGVPAAHPFEPVEISPAATPDSVVPNLENHPSEVHVSEAEYVESSGPRFKGSSGYGLTAIQHYHASHTGWFELTSLKEEFSQPALRIDYLNQFQKNEFKMTASEAIKNLKKQSLRGEVSFSPEGKVYSRWSAEFSGSAPVYGRPIEMFLGARYSSFSHANVALIFPGFELYLPASLILSARVLGSKVNATTVTEPKWLLGYSLKLAHFYSEQNFYALYLSSNEEILYTPLLLDYVLVPTDVLGFTAQHWFRGRFGISPKVEWQKRSMGNFDNWFSVSLGLLFKLQ